ncbi:MAG: hypothetical protein FWG41_01765 [Methanomassiliicoccaceae archaeon]|nr:hypothetical protein [Methanomassiliicoccaceae archaeon]
MSSEELAFSFDLDTSNIYAVDAFVKSKIGSLCYVSTMPETKDDMIGIGVYTDELILASVPGGTSIRYIGHKDIFSAYWREGSLGPEIVFPPLSEILEKISAFLKQSLSWSELILLQSTGEKLVKIDAVRKQMNPLLEIIACVAKDGDMTANTSKFKKWPAEKLIKNIDFLRSLGVITADGDHIMPGRKMDLDVEPSELPEMIMAKMIDNYSNYMATRLHLKSFMPYVQISNANYMTSYFGETILKWDPEMYRTYLRRIYGKRERDAIISARALKLNEAGVLSMESYYGRYLYYCEEGIYKSYSKIMRYCELI